MNTNSTNQVPQDTTCHQVQFQLIQGNQVTDALKEHLGSCPDCRRFRQALILSGCNQPAPELDNAILGTVRTQWKLSRIRRRFRYATAFAAAFVAILATISIIVQNNADPTEATPQETIAGSTQAPLTPTMESLMTTWISTEESLNDLDFQMTCSILNADDSSISPFDWQHNQSYNDDVNSDFKTLSDSILNLESYIYGTLL